MGLLVTIPVQVGALAAGDNEVSCTNYQYHNTVPGRLTADGRDLPYAIAGEFCATTAEKHEGATVQLLIHGAPYNRTYWDLPGSYAGGRTYSYVRGVAARGFPAFAIDQIGAGSSTKPVSTLLTTTVAAFVDHQVLQALKHGSITGGDFNKVIVVGHGSGSSLGWLEAGTYQDAAGLIVTGAVHHLSAAITTRPSTLYPATADPKFTAAPSWSPYHGIDPGYLTTIPGVRAGLFYAQANADPEVVRMSETGKDVVSSTYFRGAGGLLSTFASRDVHVPVLIILGSASALFCGRNAYGANFDCSSGAAVARQEQPYYAPSARLAACVVPGAGQDISLHRNSEIQVVQAVSWSARFIGQSQHDQTAGLSSAWPADHCAGATSQ